MFKETHHRRLPMGDKSALEKMLSTIRHQENENLNNIKYVYIPIRIAKLKKNLTIKIVSEDI